MEKVINLKQAKKEKERKAYSALVLNIFDDFEHADKREQLQRAAEVNAKAKETL